VRKIPEERRAAPAVLHGLRQADLLPAHPMSVLRFGRALVARCVGARHGVFRHHRPAEAGAWRRLQHFGHRVGRGRAHVEPGRRHPGRGREDRHAGRGRDRRGQRRRAGAVPPHGADMSVRNLRGAAAFVGTGLAGIGASPGFTHLDLLGLAVHDALEDAGIPLAEVDGLFTANMANILPTLAVGEYLGIRPAVAVGTNTGGNSFVDHLLWAAMALDAGLCNVALICYGSNARTGKGTPPDAPPYEAIYNPREPISSYALAAARHMHVYGTTRAQLAAVAVAARQWA